MPNFTIDRLPLQVIKLFIGHNEYLKIYKKYQQENLLVLKFNKRHY